MTPIPLTSFRILNKKSNWKKSFDEIVKDDEEDFAELVQNILHCRDRLFDQNTKEFGEFTGSTKEIMSLWLNYFVFIMRANEKAIFISIGRSNRGIPEDVVSAYLSLYEHRKVESQALMIAASTSHQYFLMFYFGDGLNVLGDDSFFNLVFEENYVSIIKSAYGILKDKPLFSDKIIDLEEFIRTLRDGWILEIKKLY